MITSVAEVMRLTQKEEEKMRITERKISKRILGPKKLQLNSLTTK